MDEENLISNLGVSWRNIQRQKQYVIDAAEETNTQVYELRDAHGNFVFIPLVVAEAQILHALTIIQKGETTNVLNFIDGSGEVVGKSDNSSFFRDSIKRDRSEDSGIDIPTVG